MMIRVDKVFGVRSEKGLGHWATGLLATVAACCCCNPHLPPSSRYKLLAFYIQIEFIQIFFQSFEDA